MEVLQQATQQALGDIERLLAALPESSVPRAATTNLRFLHSRLLEMDQKASVGQLSRRSWSLGQASIPILSILIKSVDSSVDADLVDRCRLSIDRLGVILNNVGEGREV